MQGWRHEQHLSGSRQVILVLRLVLDRQAHLRHGELVDVDAVCQGRFENLTGLIDVINEWFERQHRDNADAGHTT